MAKIHEELEETHKKVEEARQHAKDVISNFSKKRNTKKELMQFKQQEDIKRVKTGIEGLDDLMEGGIPEDSVILLTGTCGTGKSTFAMQFLVEGAMNNEPGVYVSLEESIEGTLKEMKLFGWDVDEMVKNKMLLIVQPELYNFDALMTTIENAVDKVKAKRLVIDSASIIGMYFEEEFKVRKALLDLSHMLKKLGCTTMFISEVKEASEGLSPHGVEEYVVDGVIVLYYIKKGNLYMRAISIRKMRSTDHSTKIHPIEIHSPGGIVVYSGEELFA